MTENQPSITSVAFKYGLITALVGIVYSALLMVVDIGDNRYLSSLAYVIMFAGIVLGIKQYKALNLNYISFGQGLGIGSIIAATFGLFVGIFSWVYSTFIDPDYMASVMEKQRVKMIEEGMADEQIDAAMKIAENFQGPVTIILGTAVISLIFGFIGSLIISAIMKNSKPEFE